VSSPSTEPIVARVLEDFSIGPLEDRVSRDDFFRLGLRYPQQIGIACRNVVDCVERAEALGAGPFIHAWLSPPNWTEHGERRDCKLELALGYAGDVQIELLGPGRGTDHYAQALVDTDVSLHHVGIYQRGIESIAARVLDAGFPEVVRGGVRITPALTIDFRYFDARSRHGLFFEVLDFRLLGRRLPVERPIRTLAAAQSFLRQHMPSR